MKTVVYIDDEELLCRTVSIVLEDCPIALHTFTDPEDAIAFINEHRPDLVLCDYRMPNLDGLDVLSRLEVEVPFVLVSGYLGLDEKDLQRRGVTEVLLKPMKPEQLIDLVESILAAPR